MSGKGYDSSSAVDAIRAKESARISAQNEQRARDQQNKKDNAYYERYYGSGKK